MNHHYDVIVVGAGSFGMSAGYHLAKSGVKVLLIDAHNPPHESGSHHGQTRIFRTAYTMGSAYAALALRAGELWTRLAEEAAAIQEPTRRHIYEGAPQELFRRTGVVSIGHSGSRFLQAKRESCEAFRIAHQLLDASELTALWPGFAVQEPMAGLYEPDAGVLFSEAVIRASKALALHYGARFLPDTRVVRLAAAGAGEQARAVHTAAAVYYADRVLVCGGAWAGELVTELADRIRPTRKAVGWFDAPPSLYGHGSFPAFIVNTGGSEEYYGIPDMDGGGMKLGRHNGGEAAVPGLPVPPFGTRPEDEADLKRFAQRYLPGAQRLNRGSVCLYENAPDEHFLIGQLPGRPGVWLAGGGSGHGFKFSSAIGEALGELLTTGRSRCDLSAFRIEG
ncbi:N-methyl-L-tryptophan oxidase [Paenibacillus piri]|uniref:N-methyl-L-tryptophan oxidase n=1 Tax=Paenibacillus piri TaxID=2547395 RepID=A0A4R5KLA3_9BACL|nr:N-methyl-L-tryptophan oxidase [Paenibacillus piri]TDF96361.1 N-methyl-L-tryptophan oxidase [Paenibacillus piri]